MVCYTEGQTWYRWTKEEKRWGLVISQNSGDGQWNNQTGHLERHTLLHKRYLIQQTVGQGGMGAVYKAKDVKRQTICAIKEMSLSMMPPAERQQAIQNFKVEAHMLRALNHPNLPAFTGFFTENQRYFLVMEYIDGYTLEELLERNQTPFTERRALGWARQLCDVLEYLHNQHPPIIFRDMKPGNIMLTRDGRIKLIDFGIARFFRLTGTHDTQLLGTPGFAPPEQYGKIQTDERSDIYSLAMTLFQLMTSTLPERAFGLRDVRAVNPMISPIVARALEKATAFELDDRYEDVAAFRRALLGVGTFVFENGDQATTPEELAELCSRHPEEASDYLADGEIESWLHEVGENELARETRHIRSMVDDPQESVERFLQIVLGPNAHIRGYSTTPVQGRDTNEEAPSRPGVARGISRGWFLRKPAPSPVQVGPRVLDFGHVYPGISAPLMITVNGDQGLLVSGTIQATEPWIVIDQTQFDGMSTRINVRVNSTKLRGGTHYTGTIVIMPDDEDTKDIVVTVEAEILAYTAQNGQSSYDGDLDEDEEEYDALTMGGGMTAGMIMAPPIMKGASQAAKTTRAPTAPAVVPAQIQAQDTSQKEKYGQPGDMAWEPLEIPAQFQDWFQRGLVFCAAFMAGSFMYTLLANLPLNIVPLSPHPIFVLVLAGIIPTATAGALTINWPGKKEAINRACTGMFGTLATLALVKLMWQVAIHPSIPPLQFIVLLLLGATAATVATYKVPSEYIIYGTSWLLARVPKYGKALGIGVGAILGFLLTIDVILSWFTPIGILVGVGVLMALVWHVDRLMKQQNSP